MSQSESETMPTKWQVGQKVDACDTMGNWYPAKVLDIKDGQVLIHFQKWSSRYDQWFQMDSELIRELTIVKPSALQTDLKVDDRVLGRWTDNKVYPGRIVKIFPDNLSCLVWFFDGYKKKLKLDSLQKVPDDYDDKNVEKFPAVEMIVSEPRESFVCEICNKGLRRKLLLDQHLKHFHYIDPEVSADGDIVKNADDEPLKKDMPKPEASSSESATIIPAPADKEEQNVEDSNEKLKREISQVLKRKVHLAMAAEKSAMQTGTSSNLNSGDSLSGVVSRSSLKLDENKPLQQTKRRRHDNRRSRKINFRVQKGKLTTASRPYLMKNGKPNNVLPFSDAPEVVRDNENLVLEEIVKCACEYEYESGLMVQCEHCLYWQHASCVRFTNENDVPDGYLCPFCEHATCGQNLRGPNVSTINLWLNKGIYQKFDKIDPRSSSKHPKILPPEEEDENEKLVRDRAKQINSLISVAMNIKENIAALNLVIHKKSLPEETIAEKQHALNDQLELIINQLNEIEAEEYDLYDESSFEGRLSRSSSCSTLSADLPDFFGNSSEFEYEAPAESQNVEFFN